MPTISRSGPDSWLTCNSQYAPVGYDSWALSCVDGIGVENIGNSPGSLRSCREPTASTRCRQRDHAYEISAAPVHRANSSG